MKRLWACALCAAGLALATAAPAQQTGVDNAVATETQERLAQGQDDDFDIGWLGLLGLAGLLGLRQSGHSDATRR